MDRIYVEITNICNLACSFCPGTRRPKRQMSREEFALVCERIAPHTKHIFLHLMGEPLTHPDLNALLVIAASNGLTVSITTNGTLLKKQEAILLQHAKTIHKVSISLHSDQANGNNCHQPSYIEDAIDFAKKAAKCGIYAVLRLWNLDSAERAGQNAQNESILSLLHKHYPEPWQKRHSGWRIGEYSFLECAEIFTWPIESTAPPSENGHCYGLIRQIGILADGTVVPCCLDSEGEMALGNIFVQELNTILATERATRIRDGFMRGEMCESLCRTCTYARKFQA